MDHTIEDDPDTTGYEPNTNLSFDAQKDALEELLTIIT